MRSTRGRPRGYDLDEVLDTAMVAFWRQGYQSTRLEQIEEPLHLSRSSLYHQFGSKERLFHLALERYLGRALSATIHPMRDGVAGLDDVIAFLRRLDRQVRNATPAPGCLLANTMAEFGGRNGEVQRLLQRYLRELRGAFQAALERAAGQGEMDVANLQWRADLLVEAVLGVSLAARSGTPVAQVRRMVGATLSQVEEWRRDRPVESPG